MAGFETSSFCTNYKFIATRLITLWATVVGKKCAKKRDSYNLPTDASEKNLDRKRNGAKWIYTFGELVALAASEIAMQHVKTSLHNLCDHR